MNGYQIKWMVKVPYNGQMAGDMLALTVRIKKMALEFFYGQMEEFIKVIES